MTCLGCGGPLGEDYEVVGDAGFLCRACVAESDRLDELRLRVISAFEAKFMVSGASFRRRDPGEYVVETTWKREVVAAASEREALEAFLVKLSPV